MAGNQTVSVVESDRHTIASPVPGRPFTAGRFVGLRVLDGRSIVTVRLPGCPDSEIIVVATPDVALARALTSGFRRLAWVRIDASGPTTHCEVSGIARRPYRCRLPLAAALALAEAGVATLVRVHPVGPDRGGPDPVGD